MIVIRIITTLLLLFAFAVYEETVGPMSGFFVVIKYIYVFYLFDLISMLFGGKSLMYTIFGDKWQSEEKDKKDVDDMKKVRKGDMVSAGIVGTSMLYLFAKIVQTIKPKK